MHFLHAAARNGHLSVCSFLFSLSNGPSLLSQTDSIGRTALDWASAEGHSDVEALLSGESDPTAGNASVDRELEFDDSWMDETHPECNAFGEEKPDGELMFEQEKRDKLI